MEANSDFRAALSQIFADVVDSAIRRHVTSHGDPVVASYLGDLMAAFSRWDAVYALRDREGNPVVSLSDMIAEGDLRQRADTLEREREVHKHIGDFLLFWSGVYPEFLRRLTLDAPPTGYVDVQRQGPESYYVVSTFDQQPHSDVAPTFRRLSEGFEDWAFCLGVARNQLNLAGRPAGPSSA